MPKFRHISSHFHFTNWRHTYQNVQPQQSVLPKRAALDICTSETRYLTCEAQYVQHACTCETQYAHVRLKTSSAYIRMGRDLMVRPTSTTGCHIRPQSALDFPPHSFLSLSLPSSYALHAHPQEHSPPSALKCRGTRSVRFPRVLNQFCCTPNNHTSLDSEDTARL
jgi:hypothetical protein